MLTSGSNGGMTEKFAHEPPTRVPTPYGTAHYGMYGQAAKAMAVRNGRIALTHLFLNRLGTDGTTAGLPLLGPRTTVTLKVGRGKRTGSPTSIALSPDGKTLYMTGYILGAIQTASQDLQKLSDCRSVPVVLKLDMENGKDAEVFVGHLDMGKHGTDNAHLKVPAAVDVDNQGRVYVADYLNDRIQVFKPDGSFVKTIKKNDSARLVKCSFQCAQLVLAPPILEQARQIIPHQPLCSLGGGFAHPRGQVPENDSDRQQNP